MSTSAGPQFTTSGLIYHSDFANAKSYRGDPTTNLISANGIDISAYSLYEFLELARVVEPEAPSGYALQMRITDATVNTAARSRLGDATNIPTSGTGYVSIYAKTDSDAVSIRPQIFCGVTWTPMVSLSGGTNTLTTSYKRFGAAVTFGTASLGPNPGFSMAQENSNVANLGVRTRWHSPQVETKTYATAFVSGTRGTTVATGGGVIDLSGTGNHAEIVGTPTTSFAQLGSLQVSSGNYARVLDNATLDIVGDKTLAAWIYLQSDANCGFVGKASSAVNGMALGYGWEGRGFMALAWNSKNHPFVAKDAARDYQKWVYVCGVQSGGNRTVYVYDAQGLRTATDTLGTHTWDNALNFEVGNPGTGSNGPPAGSRIGLVSVYNRAVSQSELYANFNATRSRYGV